MPDETVPKDIPQPQIQIVAQVSYPFPVFDASPIYQEMKQRMKQKSFGTATISVYQDKKHRFIYDISTDQLPPIPHKPHNLNDPLEFDQKWQEIEESRQAFNLLPQQQRQTILNNYNNYMDSLYDQKPKIMLHMSLDLFPPEYRPFLRQQWLILLFNRRKQEIEAAKSSASKH